ncbi:hypothetical protein CCACVL1_28991 [Corchorus capsularis]|uniref:Uncharacterized protein n=1 Tax=Corchorus capsularis TaxID=210143 RepID=A0A1R3G4D6_COCAP|nr:hypothetical protein CCACVL1_28991 [Corchorus capsularis]
MGDLKREKKLQQFRRSRMNWEVFFRHEGDISQPRETKPS